MDEGRERLFGNDDGFVPEFTVFEVIGIIPEVVPALQGQFDDEEEGIITLFDETSLLLGNKFGFCGNSIRVDMVM